MLNESMSVASRTRSRKGKAPCGDSSKQRKKTLAVEEVRLAATNMATPQSSVNGKVSLASQKGTAQVQTLREEFDGELRGKDGNDPEPDVICLGSSDDGDEDSEDDEAPTSTSGEDNSDSSDLDYREDEGKGEDPQSSSSSEDEVEETPSHGIAKRKATEVEFVGENGSTVDEVEDTPSHDIAKRKATEVEFLGENGSTVDEVVMKPKSKRRRSASAKSGKFHLLSIFVDSILDNQDSDSSTLGEDPILQQETCENPLPLKFTFGVEDSIVPDKTEFENEMDSLWSEMQISLMSNPTSTLPSPLENEDADVSEFEHDTTTQSLCLQGKHHLVLDEEIGMKCKFCSFLLLEIKDISPPFMTDRFGKYERQFSGIVDYSMFDGLHCEDSNNDMSGFDHSAEIEGTVWEIIPNLKTKLYPHQHEGFEFIWNNIAGGIYRDKSKNSSKGCGGCIISHAPGTGKTLLTIVFLQTYLNEYPSCRPVIVAPRSMLLTWEAEFRKWKVDIPFHNLNTLDFSGKEKPKAIGLYEKFKLKVPCQDRALARRLVKLLSWKSDRGILGISYKLFVQLAVVDNEEKHKCTTLNKDVSKILLELPGLFVLDEGHTPRNDDTLIWKALSRIKTERRIILSGTPFQNNFDELFNTLYLVRPKFAEGIQSRHRVEVNKKCSDEGKEAKRKWAYLTGSIGKDDIYEAEKLRELKAVIKPFVHVHNGRILQTTLPGLRHSVVVLRPSDLQNRILERVKETKNALLRDYYVSLISSHPSLLQQLSNKEDIKEKVSSIVSMDMLERIRLKPDKGVKTKFLMELLKLSGALGEKVLVFSQYLEPLNLIVDQIKDFFKWKEMEEILYMDGQCEMKQRQRVINVFNDPTSKARVLLASTKACSEGINLVGGSRVVLLDVTWNPSVERQAICRAYRLGQQRMVYTYHVISSGTMEGLKCYRQAEKDRLSELLFSASHRRDDHHKKEFNCPEDKILEAMVGQEQFTSMIEKIINEPKDSDLIVTYGGL
ncbi:SNF2 domain-containing protein CLASSY 3-like [Gossypium arboreum]|uniref:SNF2 domain-containing protein CLASSY 3-like n=1 Tax=Gossypium arboreum TaxID=29729 RepID=A0ABR0Q0A0_GOSAR|nr:SNF2 domain-containing protein CLASSY 3-like [Gossypium arboreum]KAK5832428.1 hypothetical protein PVK06_016230 [Gossypium arboreum]